MKLWRPRASSPEANARKTLTGPDRKKLVEEAIPVPVEIAGQWAWRLLAIVAVLVVVGFLIFSLRVIVVPFLIAMLISALLVPFKGFLIRRHWPRWLAIVIALILAAAIIVGLMYIVIVQVRHGFPDLQKQTLAAYDRFQSFLAAPPFNIDKAAYTKDVNNLVKGFQTSGLLGSGAKVIAETALSIGTGLLLTIFSTVFLVLDGARIWSWVVRLFPRRARIAVDGAGRTGWTTLTVFIRVQLLVAFVDAVFIGLGALLLHLPLAIPIAIVVFLAAFVPIVGAVVSGALAVFVALVYDDPITALIMLLIVLAVHIIEGNFLHPFITGSAVKVHPLAVVLAVAAGTYLAHIPGALFAVPVVAVVNAFVSYLTAGSWRRGGQSPTRDVDLVTGND
ncbi:MAG TPA: AI-2E family transporter [Galbitalea sp.]|jgi:predicted PurR-regulated permease PerM|nr:AI-2E family transporter [Galbitalea sp.]